MKRIVLFLLLCIASHTMYSQYKETINNVKIKKDLVKDYGMKNDNAASDQSKILQNAINELSKKGGGVLSLPKGTYSFAGIYMNSNVHLVFDKGVVIKPFIHESQKTNGVFFFTNYSKSSKGEEGFIENVSLRCKQKDAYFIVDYSHVPKGTLSKTKKSARAFKCVQVRNFLIEGLYVIDNWTTHCAGIFVPSKVPGCDKWEVFKPTNGVIRNFKSINSSPGYGLAQLHGGYNLHFENLSTTNGGITFRLETGAGGHYGGVDKITAENIYCENGATPMAMGPHTAQNGMVKVKNIKAVSCGAAFQCGPGFNDGRDNSNIPGRFADGCTIENIHAVFGMNAPVATKSIGNVPEQFLKDLWYDEETGLIRGPSRYVALDKSGDSWTAIIKNVTSEGPFPENRKGVLVQDKKKRVDFRPIIKDYPIWEQLPDYMKNSEKFKARKQAKKGDGKKKKNKKDKKH